MLNWERQVACAIGFGVPVDGERVYWDGKIDHVDRRTSKGGGLGERCDTDV